MHTVNVIFCQNVWCYSRANVYYAGHTGRVVATGGASRNEKILQVCSHFLSLQNLLLVHTVSLRFCTVYTVVQNRTSVKYSNSCTEYDPISVIFSLENRQSPVFKHVVSEFCWNWVPALFFTWQYPYAADDAKMGLCEDDHILIISLYEFKRYRVKRLMKEFPTKCWHAAGVCQGPSSNPTRKICIVKNF